jgi:magnesium-transporting ATPase (P-type)
LTTAVAPPEEVTNAYRVEANGVTVALGTDIRRGLSDREARARLEQYGRNERAREKPVPAWRRFFAQFQLWLTEAHKFVMRRTRREATTSPRDRPTPPVRAAREWTHSRNPPE